MHIFYIIYIALFTLLQLSLPALGRVSPKLKVDVKKAKGNVPMPNDI